MPYRTPRSRRLTYLYRSAIALLVLATAVVLPSAAGAQPGDTAVINVRVGGIRDAASTATPLPGAELGLYATATDDTPIDTCTSGTNGVCTFTVTVPGQVASGGRPFLRAIAAPTGWYSNEQFLTANLLNTNPETTPYRFQLPALYGGNTYTSGQQFMLDNGTTGMASSIRVSSGGIWQFSLRNPALTSNCGLKVALIVDLSSSVSGHVAALKSAMDQFIDALHGTPSQVALYTYSSSSPAVAVPQNYGLRSVASTADANAFKNLYAGWNDSTANGFTNWDVGMSTAAADNGPVGADDHFDLAVMLTDGNPTAYASTLSGYTRFREMEYGIFSANELKNQDTRVIALGVGTSLETSGSEHNLAAISGQTPYTGDNVREADYFQEHDYAEAGDQLRALALEPCTPTISVIKRIIPNGGSIDGPSYVGENWTFNASVTTDGATIAPPSATTDSSGGVNFRLTFTTASSATALIDEVAQAGYTLVQQNGFNASCNNKTQPNEPPVPVINSGSTGFTVDTGTDDAISCVVYNEAPPDDALVQVDKTWSVTTARGTTSYVDGAQPEDLQATLNLTGPGAAGPTEQGWGIPRDGYTLGDTTTISEDVALAAPGCTFEGGTLTGDTISDTPLPPDNPSADVTLDRGVNSFSIENRVTCVSHLTLNKQVLGGDADPNDWTLHAIAPNGALPGPTGTSGVSAEVTDGVRYQLAESSTDPNLLNYRQVDHRPDPSENPQSTGSWLCSIAGSDETLLGDDGSNGAVTVPLGQDVACTAVNETVPLTIIKKVDGGSAVPSDWTITATPVDPNPPGIPTQTVTGTGSPGATINVRPGQEYRLTESGGPDHYVIGPISCTNGTTETSGREVTVASGEEQTCTLTNHYSIWTVRKSSDPPSGTTVRPGQVITYTVTASQLVGATTPNAVVTDDLSDVLNHATFVTGSIRTSSGHAALSDSTLRWHIPALTGDETLTYQVRVNPGAYGVTIRNHATGAGARPCGPDPAACDSTTQYTPQRPPSTGAGMPTTGEPLALILWSASVLLTLGVLVAGGTYLRRRAVA